MAIAFPIITVPEAAADQSEAMGSKPKFWYRDEHGRRWLYKEARPETGEDWSEKVACELAARLGLPHAVIELATWQQTRGIVTPSFVPPGAALVHGNELLSQIVPGYPQSESGTRRFSRVPQHTVRIVMEVLQRSTVGLPPDWTAPAGIASAQGAFAGYLLLDAWIGSTDRHHGNWALIVDLNPGLQPPYRPRIAPTYDHASSLGRNETDKARMRRLRTKDAADSVEAYVERCTSAFYAQEGDAKPLTTLEAFKAAMLFSPAEARVWLAQLEQVHMKDVTELLHRVPADRITEPAICFAHRILEINQHRLLGL